MCAGKVLAVLLVAVLGVCVVKTGPLRAKRSYPPSRRDELWNLVVSTLSFHPYKLGQIYCGTGGRKLSPVPYLVILSTTG